MGAVASIALTAASTIGAGIMQYRAAKSAAAVAQEQARAQAHIYNQNAALARDEAEATARAGQKEEDKIRDRVKRTLGAQSAQYGAAGLSLASGTPLTVAADTAAEGEMDIGTVRENYGRKRAGLEMQAQQYNTQGRYSILEGDAKAAAYKAEGRGAMMGSLLSTAGYVASKWSNIGNSGKSGGIIGSQGDLLSGNDGQFYGYGSMGGFNNRSLLHAQDWYKQYSPFRVRGR